jgi:hypothetical protein
MMAILIAGPLQGPPSPAIGIQSAWIAMSTNGSIATAREQRVVQGTNVRLYLVVEAQVNGKAIVFSEAPRLRRKGRILSQGRIHRWPSTADPITIQWRTIEPSLEPGIYDNTGTFGVAPHGGDDKAHPARWHWCSIEYRQHPRSWGSVWAHEANARPLEAPDHYQGLGTMRYSATLQYRGRSIHTPGTTERDKGGLRQSVPTVRFRTNNTEVGYMTELLNVPYVYGSASTTGKDRHHQAERATGTDCADLIVYGWRRAGHNIKYTWSQGLKAHTRRTSNASYVSDKTYRNREGKRIEFGKEIEVGDILLWGRHVAVITERDPSNFLTQNTTILHTIWGSPAMVPLKQIGFGFDKTDFQIRRLKIR